MENDIEPYKRKDSESRICVIGKQSFSDMEVYVDIEACDHLMYQNKQQEINKILNLIMKRCVYELDNLTTITVDSSSNDNDNDQLVLYNRGGGDTINPDCGCFIQIPKCGFLM